MFAHIHPEQKVGRQRIEHVPHGVALYQRTGIAQRAAIEPHIPDYKRQCNGGKTEIAVFFIHRQVAHIAIEQFKNGTHYQKQSKCCIAGIAHNGYVCV